MTELDRPATHAPASEVERDARSEGLDADLPSLPSLAESGRYELIEYVGRGSMGAVYRALDRELGSVVAIKTIVDAGPDWVVRLKGEFRSLRGVVDRNLVQLYDLVVGDDGVFFSMEFVDGDDFVTYVRGAGGDPSPGGMMERFDAAAPQLVSAVRALHTAGHLHRDVKPTNTKVDADGRVVLLDFDLVTPLDRRRTHDHASPELAGTPAYMAPEQMLSMRVGPASDWYGVGVVLYESLTGALPVESKAGDLLTAFHDREVVPLRDRRPDVPEWLADLIETLLVPEADDRPVAEDILHCLTHRCALAPPSERRRPADRAIELTGRDRDLERIQRVYEEGGVAVVGVHGHSGIGKTELIRTFLSKLGESEREPRPVILSGRCNPQEAVRFKALDPIVDALSHQLVDSEASIPHLDSRPAAALVKLFPVLARVPELVEAARGGEVSDALEARRLGISALRRLLSRVAYSDRLVIWVDDVQWGDDDSGNLLGEILRPPDAPPLLVMLSYRTEDRGRIPMLAVLKEMHGQLSELSLREFELPPLDRASATELAVRLSASRPLEPVQVDAIVDEAGGSPFLIQAMVRFVQSHAVGTPVDLSNVVAEDLAPLSPEERRLLDLISLCGQPVERGLILRAAGLGGMGLPVIARLEARSLVRVQIASGEHGVQAYHDRIRELISNELSDRVSAEYHDALAGVFESSGRVEPDVLAYHFHGARRMSVAADYARTAADRARDALAFARAAWLYRQAREWDPRDADWQRTLRTQEAECMANDSRLVEAGRAYQAAAEDAQAHEALELRRLGTEHLITGGSVEEGIAALRSLLEDLDLRYPSSPRRALLGSLTGLGRILARGERPAAGEIDPEEAVRIDTCYGIGRSLVNMDSARGAYFSVLGLTRALDSGDRYRIARSLGVVGGLLSLAGGPLSGRGAKMMRRAREIAEGIGAPELLGPLGVAEGQVLMLSGHWHEARESSAEAVRLLSEQCQGFAFEYHTGLGNLLRSLEEIGGPISENAQRAQQLYEAATSTSNVYSETAAVQHLSFVAMARDDLRRARDFAQRGIELWDREGFHVQHLYTIRALALCDLYAGAPRPSHERLAEIWPPLRSSGILRVSQARVDAHSLRGKLALAMVRRGEGQRDALLSACVEDARRLEREKRDDARIDASLLRAGVEVLRGQPARALPLLERAVELGEESGMPLRGACAQLRRGELVGGDEGRRIVLQAATRIAEIGISDPYSWAAMYALGFDMRERAAA